MTSAELRSLFLKYFEERGHAIVSSSPLIPANDPTLLFTNAGMVQFKDVFLGREERSYVRAVSSQRCVRAGGKHNDLENVGYTARHHTFFEMLGNFSFGDYFKRDAIQYAWGFLTGTLGLPPEKLWVTVYDQDKEAEEIWLKEVGIDPRHYSRIGTKDNFWSMGDTGPCGPCSEIFYDHGPGIPGGPPGSPDEDGDRYIEIWNLVFMQYDRADDGTLTPLPKPSVDTGMGLERLAAVMQGVHNNYQIDLFASLVAAAAQLAGTDELSNSSLRVIADHIRSCSFLIADGVMPSNEGRGYVLRRIIRRAIRHGYKLGLRDAFFHKLVGPLCAEMGEAYPELVNARAAVERVLLKEEERFAETLDQGMKILDACMKELNGKEIPGETAFQLYDTYGFPVDLTADVAREQGLRVDMAGFERAMEGQREQSRAASQFAADYSKGLEIDAHCVFTGYGHRVDESKILSLLKDGEIVDRLEQGEEGVVVLGKTPFYPESGGQVGDRGLIRAGDAVFEVTDTRKQGGDIILHWGKLISGTLTAGSTAKAEVDGERRQSIAINHSAIHLLHAALRKVLGDHVVQKGSQVTPERLRFDFSHFEPMSAEQLREVERLVNEQIRSNSAVSAQVMAKDEAMKLGAMALFGEKYGDEVRVLRIGEFSTELCGGTHVERAGDIGFCKIVAETGVAAGIRRVEAVSGAGAVEWIENSECLIQVLSDKVKSGREGLDEKIQQILDRNRQLEKELERLKSRMASAAGSDLASQAIEIEGLKLLVARLDDADPKALRELVDQLKNKLGSSAILLAAVKEGKVSLTAGVSQDQTSRIKAGDLVNRVASQVGGKGGGRPDLAQAGGNDPGNLDRALNEVPDWVRQQLS
ncbi:MAG: alanine--tRNA ligase [Methylococcaceae bacterium]|nr:alanine--tRNA ligase [Methylococcaceae bacterium]